MNKRIILAFALLATGIVAATIGLNISGASANSASGPIPAHPDLLSSSPPQQVSQIALEFVKDDFVIRSGTPQVVLTQSITREDLPKLGLPAIARTTIEEPPLMLVIIKGDFGASKMPGIGRPKNEHYEYVAFVFDLWAGSPTLTMASPRGGEFRTALHDPSLPIVEAPVPAAPVSSPAPLHHYGEVVPGVPDPSH